VVELFERAARQLLVAALKRLDDKICAEPGDGISVVCKAERQLATRAGRLTVWRRYVQGCATGQRF
jgi:hypothetical protein